MNRLYVQFGCGLSNPTSFINFDSSPNLYFQRHSLFKLFWRHRVTYPEGIQFGDIIEGLPIEHNSLQGIYSSHVLEHLSYNNCIKALRNSFLYLKPGGVFRCVLPDLEQLVKAYLQERGEDNVNAASRFMEYTFLGYKHRPQTILELIRWKYTYDTHFWMWDHESLTGELLKVGFKSVVKSGYGKSVDPTFNEAEDKSRFLSSLCLEAIK